MDLNEAPETTSAPAATFPAREEPALQPAQADTMLMVAEYTALREEILKRIEIQHNVLWITLTAMGAFLVLGLEHQVSSTALLLYPVFAMIMAGAWAHNDVRIHQVSRYLAARYKELATWEAHVHAAGLRGRFAPLLVQGILVGSEVLAIAAALVLRSGIPVEGPMVVLPLAGLDVLAILTTAVVVGNDRHRPEQPDRKA